MIDSALIDGLSDDPVLAVAELCERVVRIGFNSNNIDTIGYIELLTFFEEYCKGLSIDVQRYEQPLNLSGNTSESIIRHFREVLIPLKQASIQKQTQALLGKKLFSEAEKQKVQELINKLRDVISGQDSLSDEHKRRLLLKLEELQAEIHRPVPVFDNIMSKLYIFTRWTAATIKVLEPVLAPVTELLKIINKLVPENPYALSGEDLLGLPPGDDLQ